MCDLFLFTIIIQFLSSVKEIFCPINVYRRTRTKQRERERNKKKKHRDDFYLNFFVVTFFCVWSIDVVIREKANIESSSCLDIHSFEQQKRMITRTHKQTDIKKKMMMMMKTEHEWMNEWEINETTNKQKPTKIMGGKTQVRIYIRARTHTHYRDTSPWWW